MSKRRLCGLSIGVEGVFQPTPMGGGLCESQPALAPQNAGKFLDQMLLGRSLRRVLGDQRRDQGLRIRPRSPTAARCSATARHDAAH